MKRLIYILCVCLFTGCNEDESNYDYKEINEVSVDLETVYEVKLQKMELKIQPEISQTLSGNKDNLKYTWFYSDVNSNFYGLAEIGYGLDTVSTEDYAVLKIDPEDPDLKYEHYFRLNVFDELTGIEYPYNVTVKLIKPYNGAWMVLHRQEGKTKLGAIEYIGEEPQVCDDAYFKETGRHLHGNPLCLGTIYDYSWCYDDPSALFYVMTDEPDEAGLYCQWKGFRKMDSLSRMVAPNYKGEFDYQDVGAYSGSIGSGGMLLSGGNFYQSPNATTKFYKAPLTPSITGEVYFSHGSKSGSFFLLYDRLGKRFLCYSGMKDEVEYNPKIFDEEKENTGYPVTAIPERDLNIKTTDPGHLSEDKEVVYIGTGYNYHFYALATSRLKDSCYMYEFDTYGFYYARYAAFSGYYTFKCPETLTPESVIASSKAYNGIIYYAEGEKVYRLDFMSQGAKVTSVYTHPGGKARLAKFANSGDPHAYQDFSAYEHPLNQSLGVVFEMPDGTSDLVILNLSITGKIAPNGEKWPAEQVYKGFGEVKDILFL